MYRQNLQILSFILLLCMTGSTAAFSLDKKTEVLHSEDLTLSPFYTVKGDTLPIASSTVLGGVKIPTQSNKNLSNGLNIDDKGNLTAVGWKALYGAANGYLIKTSLTSSVSNTYFQLDLKVNGYMAGQADISLQGYWTKNTTLHIRNGTTTNKYLTEVHCFIYNGYYAFWISNPNRDGHGDFQAAGIVFARLLAYPLFTYYTNNAHNEVSDIIDSSLPGSGVSSDYTVNLSISWNDKNDGTGSGLDADLIRGQTPQWKTSGSTIYSTNSGNILIGKTTQSNTSYKLDVNGNIRANKVVVNTTGADYVFDSAYQLPSIDSLENYIRQHHHLPGVAPVHRMQEQGVDVGRDQAALLKKVEELTLYLIGQNKVIKEQKDMIKALAKRVKKLECRRYK